MELLCSNSNDALEGCRTQSCISSNATDLCMSHACQLGGHVIADMLSNTLPLNKVRR